MSNQWAMLPGWVRFLTFYLFVGAFMASQMDRVGVGRLVQASTLETTFMLGPLGFLIAGLSELGLWKRAIPTQTRFFKGKPNVSA